MHYNSAVFEVKKEIPVKTSVEDHMKSQRLLGLPRITAICLLLIFASLTPSPLAAQDSRSSIKNFQHVFIIMMENTGCARHTYATDALARTGNMAAVMDTMGHANVQTTMIYQHQGLEQIRGAINLRNKENQARMMKSDATEEVFGQNLGQSLKDRALAVAVSD